MPSTKLREIERLRAVAILMVMVVHLGSWHTMLPDIATVPWSGVDLFFVISGYVVSLSFVKLLPPIAAEASFIDAFHASRPALRTFYVRRFFRIMPAALFVMLCTRVMADFFPDRFGTTGEWWVEFVSFFGGVYNYVHPFHFHFHSGVYWSLAVEEHFYLILPVLFLVFRTTNKRLLGCLGLAAFSILARAFMAKPDVEMESLEFYEKFASHFRFDSLMAGVALALVTSGVRPLAPIMPPRLMRWVVLPVVMVIIGCLPVAAPTYIMHHQGFIALWMLSGVLVGYAALDRGYILPIPLVGRFLEYVGGRSYALYLVHLFVARLDGAMRAPWPQYARLFPADVPYPWRLALWLLLWSLLAAEIVHRIVELPCMAIGRRLVDGQPAISPRARMLWVIGLALFPLVYFRHAIMLAVGPPDLARGMAVYQSSHRPDTPSPSVLVDGRLDTKVGAHTDREKKPWMMIDLGAPKAIGAIRVYNRDDGYQMENVPLFIQASNDNVQWENIANRSLIFTQEAPWRIHFRDTTARYVRFVVMKETSLCLSEVEIFTSPAMAESP